MLVISEKLWTVQDRPELGDLPAFSWQVTLPRVPAARLLGRSCHGFQFEDDSLQLVDQRVRFLAPEFIEQGSIVPERTIAFSLEALPDWCANLAIIRKDGAGVVQFVGGGNQADIGVGGSQM